MDEPKATGERVGGYRVVRRLATGGTSDVLLAKAEGPHGFERTVVLKRLLSQYKNDEDFAKMFAREAAAYAKLSHSAIVQLYDFFALDGQLVMVLEYIDGPPLSRLRGMLKAVGENLDDKASLFIAQRIFAALAAAHEVPVIHRDVNPSNVLVPWDGQVKLADFGIARVTGVTHQSAAGLIKGTYGYMAPEQVEGGAITPSADVYAAGIITWEMLTGRRAFQRGALPEIEVLRMMAEPKIPSIDVLRPDLDKNLREALNRALSPNAEKRAITADEMVTLLRNLVPPEHGRVRLAALLATIRHEPKPISTSIPPPMPGATDGIAPSTERMGGKPVPRPLAPPRPASNPGMRKITPPPGKGTLIGMPPARAPEVKTFDSLVEPPELVKAVGTESERMRLAAVVPSSIPPGILPSKGPPAPETSRMPETPRMVGNIPPAALQPLTTTLPLAKPGSGPPPPMATVPPDAIANAIASALAGGDPSGLAAPPPPPPAHTVVGAATLVSPTAATAFDIPMPAAPPPSPPPPAPPPSDPFPALDRTLSMDTKGVLPPEPASVPPPAPTPPTPAPPAPVAPSPASISGPMVVGSHDILPAPKPSSVGIIAFLVVIAIAGGVAGTVAYVKYQRSKQRTASTSVPSAAPSVTASASAEPITSASSVPAASAEPAVSAIASASAEPVASASATASAQPSATASATPEASVSPPSGAIAADMTVVKTEGAAPNRRIFFDDKVVGQTPETVTVKCGSHVVKLGSSGKPQTIDLPCGAEITVGDK